MDLFFKNPLNYYNLNYNCNMSKQINIRQQLINQCVKCFLTISEEQSIFLQCEHIICFECAKRLVYKNSIKEKNIHNFSYKCQDCETKTTFDSELVQTILNNLQEPERQSKQSFHKNVASLKKNDKQKNIKTLESEQNYDNPLTITEQQCLYCFDCQGSCFSIENYLSGLHKQHNVKSVQKAFPTLQEQADEIRIKIKTVVDHLLNSESKLNNKKKDLLETTGDAKKIIKAKLDQVRVLLINKQKQIIKELQEFMVQNFNEYDKKIDGIRQRIQTLQKYQNYLHQEIFLCQNTLSKQIEAFTFYGQKKYQMIDTIDRINKQSCNLKIDSEKYSYTIDSHSLNKSSEMLKKLKLKIHTNQQIKNSSRNSHDLGKNLETQQNNQENTEQQYQEYFKKAKNQISKKSNEIQSAMKNIGFAKRQKIFQQNNNPNFLKSKQRSIKTNQIETVREKISSNIPIPSKINSSLQKYKNLQPIKIEDKKKIRKQQDNINVLSASRMVQQRINRIETLFYNSINKQSNKEYRSNTNY